jgi:hypothetical protein
MKPTAKDVLSQDRSYHTPTMGIVGDVAELTEGPTATVAEDYGQKSARSSAPARVDE